jgi:predicted permease
MDGRMIIFLTVVALAVSLAFGLTASILATNVPAVSLGTHGATADRRRISYQRVLISSQIAFSLVLIIGSVLFIRSFRNLLTLDPGFRQEGLTFTYVDWRPLRLSSDRVGLLQEQLVDALRAQRNIESASTSTHLPLTGEAWELGVVAATNDQPRASWFTWVSPQFFSTMEITRKRGRDFSSADTRVSPHVAVINESFARQLFGNLDPIGRTFRSLAEPGYPETQYEVIGVVADTRYLDLRQSEGPSVYAPESQNPARTDEGGNAAIVTRSSLPVGELTAILRKVVADLNPQLRVNAIIPLRARVVSGLAPERVLAWLSGFFGALAVILAAVGLYGVISYIVTGRRKEIGIRLALGSSRSRVVRLVLKEVALLLTLGLGLGAIVSLAGSRAAASLLFGINPGDPLSFAGAAGMLLAVAAAAAFAPALRAARTNPSTVIRDE